MIQSLSEYIDAVSEFRKRFHWSTTILFRGQSNTNWSIDSSLERFGMSSLAFKKYYSHIDFLKPEINSFGKNFERKYKFQNGYENDFSDYYEISFNQFPELEYLTYLRHHGFPSPLIDFSKSEYIALFFACEDALYSVENKTTNGKVFIMQSRLWEDGGAGMTEIHRIGHYIETDQRHISQQSEYLIACRFSDGCWSFAPFMSADCWQNQEIGNESFAEIDISASAKIELLRELAKMNINHFTFVIVK